MRVLLDTHIALWAVTDHPGLTPHARQLISDAQNVFVSAASIWEIAVKHTLGRGNIGFSGGEALEAFTAAGFELLSISAQHAAAVDALAPLHADPFDRMLIAQAQTEPLHLLTHDAQLARYSPLITLV